MRKPRKRSPRTPKNHAEDLAARLQVEGITMERDSVSRIEIGTRFVTDYELVVLARVLNVSLEWLTEQNEK